jgi:hypothetical protein
MQLALNDASSPAGDRRGDQGWGDQGWEELAGGTHVRMAAAP